MGDADMAIHASPAFPGGFKVDCARPGVLPGLVHVVKTVAITAFP